MPEAHYCPIFSLFLDLTIGEFQRQRVSMKLNLENKGFHH